MPESVNASRSRLRPLLYPALALATILLLGVGLAMVWGIASLKRSSAWVEHSYQVIGHIDAAQAALRRAEGRRAATGARRCRSPMPTTAARLPRHSGAPTNWSP